MFGWVGSAWDAIRGGVHSIWGGIVWAIHRFFGLIEMFFSIWFKPRKFLRLRVVILRDGNLKALATEAELEAVVGVAKAAFRSEMNVRIVPVSQTDPTIVTTEKNAAPDFVLTPGCEGDAFREVFTQVGHWFRGHSGSSSWWGNGEPVTVFVVDDIRGGNAGCSIMAAAGNYAYVDDGALHGSPGQLLTLAHELGHSCDLRDRDNGTTLMVHSDGAGPRTKRLTRWQRAVIRSSKHVTYHSSPYA